MDAKLLSTDRPVAIYYTFLSEVSSFAKVDSSHCSLALSGSWKLINTTIGTIDLDEESSETRAGVLYSSKLKASCPGQDQDTPGDIASVSGRKVLIRIDYRSGLKKIIGNKTTGPKLFFKISSQISTSRTLQSEYKSVTPNLWLL